MRKKILRSRSGFEKPGSREEAIMQNILGASNVLEPSESNIEEILKSILYNTPYTKEAEFEIEKILLAIKNNGTYDGECESRDLKILFAILNDLDYTEEAESRIEELFIEWLNQRSNVKVLEGIPPLTFVAKGEPLKNYEISGNTVQNGTPTPDNPIMPQGTGERTGNLAQWEKGGISTTTGANEAYRTKEQVGTCEQLRTQYISCIGDSNYVLSVNKYPVQSFISFYDENKNYLTRTSGTPQGDTRTFKTNINAKYMRAQIAHVTQDQVYPAIEENVQFAITLGSTPLPYEPYGYKLDISSANTTTPVYLGEVESTRRIKKLVLDSTEDWKEGTSNYYFFINVSGRGNGIPDSTALSTHTESGVVVNNNGTALFFKKSVFVHSSLADFKAYLTQQYAAGTPVTIWYVLATETTGIVNEPLMKIGDYADTLSMEQAGVEIPTVNGSNTLDVDTTVKPSNFYIEYK